MPGRGDLSNRSADGDAPTGLIPDLKCQGDPERLQRLPARPQRRMISHTVAVFVLRPVIGVVAAVVLVSTGGADKWTAGASAYLHGASTVLESPRHAPELCGT